MYKLNRCDEIWGASIIGPTSAACLFNALQLNGYKNGI